MLFWALIASPTLTKSSCRRLSVSSQYSRLTDGETPIMSDLGRARLSMRAGANEREPRTRTTFGMRP